MPITTNVRASKAETKSGQISNADVARAFLKWAEQVAPTWQHLRQVTRVFPDGDGGFSINAVKIGSAMTFTEHATAQVKSIASTGGQLTIEFYWSI